MEPKQEPMAQDSKGVKSALTDATRLRLFIESVADYALYMLSPDGYVISWNAGAQRIKGYTQDEIIGEHFSRFYSEADRAAGLPERGLRTALEQGKFEGEGWRVRKDGTLFWANVVIDPIRDSDGELIGFAKITRDITERKRADEALHASEERFRMLVQGVTDYAIYMLSPDGEVTNWNSGAERIKGYRRDEVLNTHFSRFYTKEESAAGLPARALHIATTEGRFESEGWRVRKDGTRFWAHVVIDRIRNDMGELVGFAKITRDITERRDAAAALERAKEALFQSQKLEALGKLTGGVAHDFNNLLAVIVSGLELLSNEVQGPFAVKTIESMQRAATRGATLTGQLLSFARRQPLQQNKYNLNSVINAFEAVLRRACGDAVKFELNAQERLSPVFLDATQFEAALLNLVTNAHDAMPDGGTLAITTENVELRQNEVGNLPQGRFVKLTVRDTGTGMPAEVAAHAIEPFFTTKGPGKGTGMGLSQVYGLVHQSGGDLVLESEVGKGTAVSLYLPALEATEEDLASADTNAGNDKALLVDDQPDVLDVAVDLFRSMGYEVFSANNGAGALDIMKRMPDIDVLFTDVLMPGMNGIQLAQEARKCAPGIKVILASGYPAPALAAENTGFRDFDFVSKPYRMSEILKLLRKKR
ncbi:MAG: sensor histidine kinase [Burkholderia sp.]|nr:sensor histidine kinase [Burkholderia sp.]